jgi:hypothetical protein
MRSWTKKVATTACAVVGGLGLVVATGTPAWAIVARVYVDGDNYASVGDNRRWVEVCDRQRDGNGVYARFYLHNGTHRDLRDPNGSDGGCGNATYSSNVRSFYVCEDRTLQGDVCRSLQYDI